MYFSLKILEFCLIFSTFLGIEKFHPENPKFSPFFAAAATTDVKPSSANSDDIVGSELSKLKQQGNGQPQDVLLKALGNDYNQNSPPKPSENRPVNVHTAIEVHSIIASESKDPPIQVDLALLTAWQDLRLKTLIAQNSIETPIYFSNDEGLKRIWVPQIFVANIDNENYFRARITNEGYVFLERRMKVSPICYKSEGSEQCEIRIQSIIHTEDAVKLVWIESDPFRASEAAKSKMPPKKDIVTTTCGADGFLGSFSCLKVFSRG